VKFKGDIIFMAKNNVEKGEGEREKCHGNGNEEGKLIFNFYGK
jgi:hypothetical protein